VWFVEFNILGSFLSLYFIYMFNQAVSYFMFLYFLKVDSVSSCACKGLSDARHSWFLVNGYQMFTSTSASCCLLPWRYTKIYIWSVYSCLLNCIQNLFQFSLQFLSEVFLILRRTERDVTTNVYWSLFKVPTRGSSLWNMSKFVLSVLELFGF
jgi:hypothetical protein